MTSVIRLALLALLIVSCNPTATSPADPDPADAAAAAEEARQKALSEIEAANAAITSLASQGEFEAAGAYFAPDVVQIISGQPMIEGREAWIAAQRAAAEIGDWSLELEVLDFEYFGDHAVERGRGVQSFEAFDNSPMPSMELTGDYLVLWKKTDQGWQIQYDYVVVEQPAAE